MQDIQRRSFLQLALALLPLPILGQTASPIATAPAGKMEAFFDEREKLGIKPGEYAKPGTDATLLHAFGMELVGPPLVVE